jgi:putative FmdB family regulatory protein
MPIYEFSCKACGKVTEVMQRVGDPPPRCSACGSKRTARAVSRTSFHLKGGGWYADLYATPQPASADKADKAEAKEPGKGPGKDAGPEGKPAATTPPAGAEAPKAAPVEPGQGPTAGAKATPAPPSSRARRRPTRSRR